MVKVIKQLQQWKKKKKVSDRETETPNISLCQNSIENTGKIETLGGFSLKGSSFE